MKAEGSKEELAYQQAKNKYLAIGKRYSVLLKKVMDLDPNVLKIAEEILATGDHLSAQDNRFLTSFYKEIRTKSKIDKSYYDILLELKKTKNELDNAVSVLSSQRINFLLRKAGIPPKRTNQDTDIVVTHINDSSINLLEKISLPGVLSIENSEKLDELIVSEQLVANDGNLIAQTKAAREYLKSLEKMIRQRINDQYFLSQDTNLLKHFHKLNESNLIDFIRATADKEHVREIERRIDSKDLKIGNNKLIPLNEKGKKYISLLIEELSQNLDKKSKTLLLAKNELHTNKDDRIKKIKGTINDLDIAIAKHSRLSELAGHNNTYAEILAKVKSNKEMVNKTFAELITLQETVSASYADIKKKMILNVNQKQINTEELLSLMVAVRYLSIYENKYEEKLSQIENMLGIFGSATQTQYLGPDPVTKLTERYASEILEKFGETDEAINDLLSQRLAGRAFLGEGSNETIISHLIESPQMTDLKKVVATQHATKQHIAELLRDSNCLYLGFANLSELLAELIELDIDRREKTADLTHELELAHKELWLARINNSSKQYINSNFMDISTDVRSRALSVGREAVDGARNEIREIMASHRSSHKKYSNDFAKDLRQSLQSISKGGDVTKITADLKEKFKHMSENHDKVFIDMEKDIIMLEKRLSKFEKNVPNGLEKVLMSDIRQNI